MTFDQLTDPGMITVYGVDWCEDTTRARTHLATSGIDVRYVDLDLDTQAKAALVERGYVATPVVATPDGTVLVEPSDAQLDAVVAAHRAGGPHPG